MKMNFEVSSHLRQTWLPWQSKDHNPFLGSTKPVIFWLQKERSICENSKAYKDEAKFRIIFLKKLGWTKRSIRKLLM
jgi:hypothetical protein